MAEAEEEQAIADKDERDTGVPRHDQAQSFGFVRQKLSDEEKFRSQADEQSRLYEEQRKAEADRLTSSRSTLPDLGPVNSRPGIDSKTGSSSKVPEKEQSKAA